MDQPSGWRVAAAATFCLVVCPSALIVSCFGVLVRPLSIFYGWSPGQIGPALSFMAFAIMLTSLLQGRLLDRFGGRRLVMAFIPIFAVALACLAVLPRSLPLFYLTWFLLPFASLGLWPAVYLKTVSGWFDRHLGLATGLANGGIGIGTIVLPPLITWIMVRGGLQVGFVAMGGLALLAWPVAYFSIRENPSTASPPATSGSGISGVKTSGDTWTYARILHDATYRRIAMGFLLIGVAGTGLLGSIVPILMSKGLSMPLAVSGIAGYGMLNLIGRLVTGALLDRFHVTKVVLGLAMTTVAALICLILNGPVWSWLAAAWTLGLFAGGEFDILAYALRRYFGLDGFGRRYGLAFSAFQLGATGGAALLAASVLLTSSYDLALVVLAMAASAGAALLWTLGSYPSRSQ
ncbi:MFS transporter [Novosphingobium humi]|uniref:MFS transporter n=1 Tax=Novosphingobium humi TaxID=2282397 RepID=A0ABY7U125_9SPHN|nr:MFS transporter [Novosphingobium humi]WCT79222.1 MFS transporter [Novosphingobium humi]